MRDRTYSHPKMHVFQLCAAEATYMWSEGDTEVREQVDDVVWTGGRWVQTGGRWVQTDGR